MIFSLRNGNYGVLNLEQFRDYIVAPALKEIDQYSKAAERLIIGTALVESDLTYLHQINGPALGLLGMEPFTHDSIWDDYLKFRFHLSRDVHPDGKQKPSRMLWDLKYAVKMARCKYLPDRQSLPESTDILGMAKYYKRVYNTKEGKGTVEGFIQKAQRILEI